MGHKHTWGWPIATYLFLGGLSGGMIVVGAVADLFFGKGSLFLPGQWVAAASIGVGSLLLVFDLGRPLKFYRVFSRQRVILTVGAWMLITLAICGAVYGSFALLFLPWSHWDGLHLAIGWISLLLGIGVTVYTGVFLGTMKSRPFWNSAALPVLFLVSGMSTGIAGQSLVTRVVAALTGLENLVGEVENLLRVADLGLLLLEGLILMTYVLMMRTAATETTARAAATWLQGSKAVPFWGGVLGLGIVVPSILYALGGEGAWLVATFGVLIGGLVLRFLIVYTDDRKLLPGEEQFFAHLPGEGEEFLAAWN